jgi:nucleotide-binding universal stress UspA family protein
MTIKTILVHLHDVHRSDRLLQAAIPIARAFDAHIIGISVVPPYVIIPTGESAGTTVTIDEHREAYRVDMMQLKKAFNDATAGQTFNAEWREEDAGMSTVAAIMVDEARLADLVVISQRSVEWAQSNLFESPERLALETGRPVLLVPNAGNINLPPKRVTIAWNERREAARAVFDALPLLRQAEAVNVLSLTTGRTNTVSDLPGAEICATLSRHGIKCEATTAQALAPDVGSEILRHAKAFGSDLLVMGCYGHSRLREFILGGASRDILAQTDIPVLLSH